jgi:hypothetical protein
MFIPSLAWQIFTFHHTSRSGIKRCFHTHTHKRRFRTEYLLWDDLPERSTLCTIRGIEVITAVADRRRPISCACKTIFLCVSLSRGGAFDYAGGCPESVLAKERVSYVGKKLVGNSKTVSH